MGNTPNIRFKGFTDDWEQRKLGELLVGVSEKNSDGQYSQDDILACSLGTELDKKTIFFGLRSTEESVKSYRKVKIGDVIYTKSPIKGYPNGIVRTCKIADGIVPSLYCVYKKRDDISVQIDTRFIQSYLEEKGRLDQYLYPLVNVGARNNVNITDKEFLEGNILMPPQKEEQTEIVESLEKITNLITLHQRKCDETKKLKKFMLQKMFPKKDEKKPEIRFAGFTDDWEQRKLPEFVTFFNGLTYTPDDVEETGTLVLRSSNVKNGEIVDADNVYVNDKVVTSENVQEGDIIVVVRNGSRALIGKHAQIKDSMPNTVIGAFMSGMRSEHSSFVNALLDTSAFENEIAKNMGATINQITGYMFSRMEFMIPSGEEQQKIGEYFQGLDDLITLHQRKCDEIKEIKKFMLQNMFPQKG